MPDIKLTDDRDERTAALEEHLRRAAEVRDAARYRWLREGCCSHEEDTDEPHLVHRGEYGINWREALDAAVDAAMGETP